MISSGEFCLHNEKRQIPKDLWLRRYWALAALTLLAAALRLFGLDSDLWLDEVVSLVKYFRLSPSAVFTAYESPNQHLLYSVVASISRSAFGESAWAVRLPAALAGIASIPAFFWLASAVAPRREAWLATALLTVSYHHIWFSQSARGYSPMMFCVIMGTALLIRARAGGARWHWWAYAGVMGCGILFLQNTVFVLLGHAAAAMVVDWRLRRPHLLAAGGAVAIAVAGHLPLLAGILEIWRTMDRAGGGSGITSVADFWGLVLRGLQSGFFLPGVAVGGLLAAFGWMDFWKKNRWVALAFLLSAGWGVLAIVVLQYGAYPRAFLYCLPFALLFIVRGARCAGEAVSARPLAGDMVAGFLVLCSIGSLYFLYRHPKQDYSGALTWVDQRRAVTEILAGAGMAGGVYQLYYRPDLPVVLTLDELRTLEQSRKTVWVLFSFTRDMRLRYGPLYDYLQANYRIEAALPGTLDDGTIYIVRRDRFQ